MDFDLVKAIAIFVIGLLASFISGIAGGGGGLIMAPLFILVGIDPKITAATTTFGGLGLSIGSLSRLKKEKELRRDFVKPLTVIAMIGALVGPLLLFTMESERVQTIFGWIILLMLPLFLLKKKLGSAQGAATTRKKVIGFLLYAILITLQVAFGAGIGIGIPFVLVTLFGLTMIEASATLRVPQLVSTVISLVIFAWGGLLHYAYGIVLMIAMMVGGYAGSHAAIKAGDGIVRWVYAALAAALAVTLLLD